MKSFILSVKWRNAYGNIGSGVSLLVLGLALFSKTMEAVGLASAIALLVCACTALFACLAKDRELMDEMAVANERAAASLAIKATLVLLGVAACVGLACRAQVNLGALACVTMGGAMFAYGIVFAWLERC